MNNINRNTWYPKFTFSFLNYLIATIYCKSDLFFLISCVEVYFQLSNIPIKLRISSGHNSRQKIDE